MAKLFIMLASINGLLAVSLGAFAAHGLEQSLSPELLDTFQTGTEYHMTHALALFGIGMLLMHRPDAYLTRVSGYLFLLGIILFSGSLYLLSLTGVNWLGAITPIGGACFLAGWGCLFWSALKNELTMNS